MARPVLDADHFHNEDAAFEYVEAQLWPHGPTCPHCGNADDAKIGRLSGKSSRPGLRKCYVCRKTFTVRMGSIFEDSHFPLRLWLQAIQLITASKKGVSTRQIQRTFNCSMKTAWFLMHRIREAMRSGDLAAFGGEGGVVEVDETFIGRREGVEKGRGGYAHKVPVLSLVHRESGQCRSFVVDDVTRDTLLPIVMKNVQRETYIMTDEAGQYRGQFRTLFLGHGVVNHTAGEYSRRHG